MIDKKRRRARARETIGTRVGGGRPLVVGRAKPFGKCQCYGTALTALIAHRLTKLSSTFAIQHISNANCEQRARTQIFRRECTPLLNALPAGRGDDGGALTANARVFRRLVVTSPLIYRVER